jgi:UDP:flavonoid glycosyltransferase YjiC (YdhE family)
VRVLVSVFPGKGHFHPVAPLALELQRLGHDVLVATGDDLTRWVRDCGIAARGAGLTEHEALQRAHAEAPPGVPIGSYMFACVAAPPMLADLRRIAAEWGPDLVVHEEAEYAAPLLAAELGLPCITHSWPAPVAPLPARAQAVEWLQPLWARSGLAPARLTGNCYLDSCPPLLQTADLAAVANVLPVRPGLFDGPSTLQVDGLSAVPHPFVYVTLGTVPQFARAEILTKAADAAARTAAAVLVTSGPVAPHELGPLPANVRVEGYVPQRQALAHADLLVSHGGANSNLGALRYGVPHLVLPQGAPSQQRCGDHTVRLGTGVTIPPDEQSVANISNGVERLLRNDSFRMAAQRVAEDLRRVPDVQAVLPEALRAVGAG